MEQRDSPTTDKVMTADSVEKTSSGGGEEAPQHDLGTLRDHWKCLAACTMVSMCPFQYGIGEY